MRLLFLNIACILTVFDIEAPVDEKLEASFNEERVIRYDGIFLPLPPPSAFMTAAIDIHPKENCSIQVHDKASLRCELEVDEDRLHSCRSMKIGRSPGQGL